MKEKSVIKREKYVSVETYKVAFGETLQEVAFGVPIALGIAGSCFKTQGKAFI